METAFEYYLNTSKNNQLLLRIYLLNSRGGPWFSFGTESIEDFTEIKLFVRRVDREQKIIKLGVLRAEQEGFKLLRRPEMDRMSWCVKFRVDGPNSHEKSTSDRSKLCTIIAPDTPIEIGDALPTYSVSTIDMQMFYTVRETPEDRRQIPLVINIKALECSYSFLFSKIDEGKHHEYGSWSVHPSGKKQLLIDTAYKMGLDWSNRYWTFDLVLQWLTLGEYDQVDGVVEFLKETEQLLKIN